MRIRQKLKGILTGAHGVRSTYKAVLIYAVCLCGFALTIMFNSTVEHKTRIRQRNSLSYSVLSTKTIAALNYVSKQEKKATVTTSSTIGSPKVVFSSKQVASRKSVPENFTNQQKVPAKTNTTQFTLKTFYPVTLERDYILENPHLCSSVKNLTVLIIIHTAPGNFERRLNIRRNYANATHFQHLVILRVLFLLGQVKDASVQDKILTEFKQYGDILQGDFIDAYRNLTHKGVMAYKWIQERCRNAEVILKADDDMVVNTYKLITDYLPGFRKRSRSILCNHILPWTMGIIRDKRSKWYVNENEFRGYKVYPRYCSGFFVMITNDIIPAIYKSAYFTPFFWVDDVYLYGLLPGKVEDVTYIGLKNKPFTLSPYEALECYRNRAKVCNYLVAAASQTKGVDEIWKHMTEQYLNKTTEDNASVNKTTGNDDEDYTE